MDADTEEKTDRNVGVAAIEVKLYPTERLDRRDE
jgi:hypothetical protein